jgi:hypothetical protein
MAPYSTKDEIRLSHSRFCCSARSHSVSWPKLQVVVAVQIQRADQCSDAANHLTLTAHQAALRSAMHAAALHHNKALGKRGVNHLFRLPATLEERIGKLMHGFQPND